jgi:hypothetical protein
MKYFIVLGINLSTIQIDETMIYYHIFMATVICLGFVYIARDND